ncbi:hypothetical protein BHE74_00029751 [Ensete ventricosum]|nr:hypothetical protein BHE74_00029751 [Ensete ventricosum]
MRSLFLPWKVYWKVALATFDPPSSAKMMGSWIMLNDEGGGLGHKAHQECSEPCLNSGPNHTLRDASSSQSGGPQKGGAPGAISQVRHMGGAVDFPTISIVISHPEDIPKPDMSTSKAGASEGYDGISAAAVAASSKKVFLPTESDKDQCRQVASNVPFPELQPTNHPSPKHRHGHDTFSHLSDLYTPPEISAALSFPFRTLLRRAQWNLQVMTASAEDGEEPPLVDLSEPTGKSPTAVVDEELDPGISELTLVEETETADTDGKEKPVAAEEHPQQ